MRRKSGSDTDPGRLGADVRAPVTTSWGLAKVADFFLAALGRRWGRTLCMTVIVLAL